MRRWTGFALAVMVNGGGAFVRADDGGKFDLCGCVGGERFGGKDTRTPGHVFCSPSLYRDVELASELVISFIFNKRAYDLKLFKGTSRSGAAPSPDLVR